MTALLLDRPDTDAEFARLVDELTRRGFLAGGAGTAALLGLAACGADDHPAAGGGDAGRWTFADDLGRKISLPRRPTRIAALGDGAAATLWAAGLHVVAAPLNDGNLPFLYGAGMPHSGVVPIDAADGSTSIEKLAATRTDLIIDTVNDGKLAVTSQEPQIAKLAPVLGLNENGPTVDAIIDRAARLVAALGIRAADSRAHAGYRAAEARLKKALAAKPGLSAMFCFADGSTGLDVMVTGKWPFMQTLAGLGLDLIQAGKGGNGYFTAVSWENVPTLPVDLVIYTSVGLPSTNPAWKAMPAIKAGQYLNSGVGWYAYYYSNYVTMLDTLTAAIEKTRTGVGPR